MLVTLLVHRRDLGRFGLRKFVTYDDECVIGEDRIQVVQTLQGIRRFVVLQEIDEHESALRIPHAMTHDILERTFLQAEVDSFDLIVLDIENEILNEGLVIALEGERRFDAAHEITVGKSSQLQLIALDDLRVAVFDKFNEPFPAVLGAERTYVVVVTALDGLDKRRYDLGLGEDLFLIAGRERIYTHLFRYRLGALDRRRSNGLNLRYAHAFLGLRIRQARR